MENSEQNNNAVDELTKDFIFLFKKILYSLYILYFILILLFLIYIVYILQDGHEIFEKQNNKDFVFGNPYYGDFVGIALLILFYHIGMEIRSLYNKSQKSIKEMFLLKNIPIFYHIVIFSLLGMGLVLSERNLILYDNVSDFKQLSPIKKELVLYKQMADTNNKLINKLENRLKILENRIIKK